MRHVLFFQRRRQILETLHACMQRILMNVNVMMMQWSQKFLIFDPYSPYVAHDIATLRQMPLGWHYI
jgi:hypothetical protein